MFQRHNVLKIASPAVCSVENVAWGRNSNARIQQQITKVATLAEIIRHVLLSKAFASFHKSLFIWKNVHPRTYKLTPSKIAFRTLKSCFGSDVVQQCPIGIRWFTVEGIFSYLFP